MCWCREKWGAMREGTGEDELPSQMPHFMAYFFRRRKTRKKVQIDKTSNLMINQHLASAEEAICLLHRRVKVEVCWSCVWLPLEGEQTWSLPSCSFIRGNMSVTLSQLQDFLSVLARVNKPPWGWLSVCRSVVELKRYMLNADSVCKTYSEMLRCCLIQWDSCKSKAYSKVSVW